MNNQLLTLSCPNGLLFDPIQKKCTYANQVNCEELKTTTMPINIFTTTELSRSTTTTKNNSKKIIEIKEKAKIIKLKIKRL